MTGAMGVKPFADNFSGKFSLLTNVCKLLFQSEFFWQLIVGQFNCQSFLTFLSECTESSDCPNGGQNYECVAELCSCKPGHALDGDACVGMLPNCYFYHSSGTKTLIAKYEQSD